MKNVTEHFYRTWTVFKTSTHMTIECNGVVVWSIEFKKRSEKCNLELQGKEGSKISFNKGQGSFPATFYRATTGEIKTGISLLILAE
jgi:hypothetical protein